MGTEPQQQKADRQRAMRQVAEYSSLALSLPIAAVLGYLLGDWLDGKFGTGFLGVTGLILGVASGFMQLISKVTRDGKSL